MARIAQVIATTEHLLERVGPEKTSIPAIAEASGVPRAAIYPFFADKYVLFSHVAKLHMESLVATLEDVVPATAGQHHWRGAVAAWVEAAADYYNRHPVASILLLRGGLVADGDAEAHQAKNQTLNVLFRARVTGLTDLPSTPDVVVLALEIAFACMKYGYMTEGVISPAICHEAVQATQAYLGRWERS